MTEQPEPTEAHRFDIGVSFAGEEREFVDEIVDRVQERGLQVFYDDDQRVESWGRDLGEYFADVYQNQCTYAVMFISRHYAEKVWTRHERRSILARALNQQSEYVLPVRFDDTQLDGLLSTVGYLDARREGIQGIADAIVAKCTSTDLAIPAEWTTGVPSDEPSTQALLALKPPGWEFLYYGGLLLQGQERLRPRILDMEMGYARHRDSLDGYEAFEYLKAANQRYAEIASTFGAVLDLDVQERAFGAPGTAGDPERILHIAERLLGVVESFLDVIEDIRGSAVPEEFVEARDLLAKWGVKPTTSILNFISDFADQMTDLPERLKAGEDIHIEMVVELAVEDGLMDDFVAALERAVKSLE